MPKTYRVTLRYPDGNTMFIGTVTTEETVELPKPGARNGGRATTRFGTFFDLRSEG